MLDKKYIGFLKELKSLKSSAANLLKSDSGEEFEDRKCHEIIGYIKEEMENALSEMELLSKATLEGKLVLNSQGRFNLDTAQELYFTCGSPIEILIDGEWYRGRVESDGSDYYFYNYESENQPLEEGMKARIRVDRG
ncbi:DUF5348 domain-containing protein [uncultured Ilyobacter sp.]|jgi:hypothetical protein|uniref:DUF5348 domain-containing protein n=1 Tax=uncultured Ilyobacter sp. TaxID=544433 RepID=UPI0029BFD94A|nr:DUF5348 domain-containing protein [uncultured Ilyobacter sp.]